jgi:RNA recognition motif-containing protein
LNTVYIAKLARGTREGDLRDGFARFGTIKNIALKSSFAFLSYDNPESATEAISRMNGCKFVNGEEIVVEQSGTSTF